MYICFFLNFSSGRPICAGNWRRNVWVEGRSDPPGGRGQGHRAGGSRQDRGSCLEFTILRSHSRSRSSLGARIRGESHLETGTEGQLGWYIIKFINQFHNSKIYCDFYIQKILFQSKTCIFVGGHTPYDDLMFRNTTGHDVTNQADKVYERFDHIVEAIEELSATFYKNDLDDLDIRSALRFLGWRPTTPMEHAVEYFEYDFETAHIPDLSSVKYFSASNPAKIDIGKDYFVNDPRGYEAVVKEVEREVRRYPNSEILKNQWVDQVNYTICLHYIIPCL